MENNIDKLFKSKLGGDSAPYDPAAWGRMAALIDEDDDVNGNGIPPPPKNRWRTYIGLALLLMISLIGFWQISRVSDSSLAMKNTSANDKESWSALNSDAKSVDISEYEKNSASESILNANTQKSIESTKTNNNNNTNNIKQEIKQTKLVDQDKRINIKNQNVSDLEFINNDEGSINENEILNDNSRIANKEIGETQLFKNNNDSASGISKSLKKSGISNANNQDYAVPIGLEDNENQNDQPFLNNESEFKSDTESQNEDQVFISENNDMETPEEGVILDESSRLNNSQIAENDFKNNIPFADTEIEVDDISVLNPNLREEVLVFPFLSTSTSVLRTEDKEIVPLMTQIEENSRLKIGLFSSLAYNEGYLSQTGIGFDYNIGSSWSVTSGVGFEYAKYNSGAIVTVQDKLYSFGSNFVDRTMTMNKRTSIFLPIQLKRSFNKLSIHGGILLNYHIAGNGTTDDGEGNVQSVWVSDDVFKSLSISYQAGASYLMNRRLELNVGFNYRSSDINNTASTQNAGSKIYPSLGFNYLIAKY